MRPASQQTFISSTSSSPVFVDSVNQFTGSLNFNLGTDGSQYVNGRIGNWIVDRGEIGIGSRYNRRWGNNLVFELDSDQNQVYKYILDLSGGLYELSFDWAAR